MAAIEPGSVIKADPRLALQVSFELELETSSLTDST